MTPRRHRSCGGGRGEHTRTRLVVKLHERVAVSDPSAQPVIARVTRDADLPMDERSRHALLAGPGSPRADAARGFAASLLGPGSAVAGGGALQVALSPDLAYLDEGDVIRVDPPRRHLNVIYRRNSPHNSLLLTERCNSR